MKKMEREAVIGLFVEFLLINVLLVCLLFNMSMAQEPPAAAQETKLSAAELDQLVAPVALYQDVLITEILMASTYPLEVVEADRWAEKNKNLTGDDLKKALEGQSWDDSVKALAVTPTVLDMMSEQLDWTKKLGDAMLAQQKDVMAAIQRLRLIAFNEKTLATTQEQTVTVNNTPQGEKIVVVESSSPETVYVPYYDSSTAYGTWPHSEYPPASYPPPPWYSNIASGLLTGLAFGAGFAIIDELWDDDSDWGGGDINQNVNISNTRNTIRGDGAAARRGSAASTWQHNPAHRQGVQYGNPALQKKYAPRQAAARSAEKRPDFRGRSQQPQLASSGPKRQASPTQSRKSAETTRSARSSSGRDNAFSRIDSGRSVRQSSSRGHESLRNSRSSGRASGGQVGGGRSGAGGSGGGGGGGRGGGGGGRGGGGRR